MTRHGKNCTAGAVYTYHEKQKDTKSGGYGTIKKRLGKDSIKNFDCCSLTLQPCRIPVITTQGYLYDKESILENIVHQKVNNARKMKEYEKQKKKDEDDLIKLAQEERRARAEAFDRNAKVSVTRPDKDASTSNTISNMSGENASKLPSFWVPALTPQSEKKKLVKPDTVVRCPMSGDPFKMKDLIPVNFTEIKDPDEKKSFIARENRYMCAVTHDVLSNSVPCAFLKTSGSVVTMECVEKLIRKDMIDPINGKPLKEKDIIPIQRGGTGYAKTNKVLNAQLKNSVLMS